jgi:chromosomal replication initiation ATPase DnaA
MENSIKSLEELAIEVAKFFDIDYKTFGKSIRTEKIATARHIYFKIAQKLFPEATLTDIGKILNRDHVTVYCGIKSVDKKYYKIADLKKFCTAKKIQIN